MDEQEKDHKLEDTQQEADSKTVDDLVKETENDKSPESMKETHDGDESTPDLKEIAHVLVSEKLEEEKVAVDSVTETEPVGDIQPNNIEQSSLYDESNGVSPDYLSKEIDSFSGQNGFSPIVPNAVVLSKGIVDEQALDDTNVVYEKTILPASNGNPGESSGAADLVSKENVSNISQSADVRGLDEDKFGENSNMSETEVPESTENQTFIPVIPSPLQRTSWRSCCGLFEVLRRSDR